MKKILYIITQSELGGAQIYVRDLAFNLKNNFDIIVASGEKNQDSWLRKECGKNGIKYIELKHVKREISFWQDFLALLEIRKLIKKERPDTVHLNSSKISILGSLASIFSKSKIIYTVHGWVFNEPMPYLKKFFYINIEKFTAKFKNKLICVSHCDYETAIDKKICSKDKLSTIHNGINLKYSFSKDDARLKLNNLNSNLHLKKDDFLIGSIGNLYKNKGYEYLIHAIKILVDNDINIKQFIIGDGEERKTLEDEVSQLKLKKNIFFIGSLENASEYLKAFDLYVCSSVKEGLSYTLIEAMLSSLPIVATDVGGNGELIENNKNGILTEAKNSEKLASALLSLINNKELANKLAINAEIKAREEFSLEQMVEKTKKYY